MSIDFKKIRGRAFKEFCEFINDDISIINPPSKANFSDAKNYREIWEVKTGLYDEEKSRWLVEEITMYLAFTSSFPLESPRIYYDRDDFEKLGYIPHTSITKNDVCVYDEFVIVDEKNPARIIIDTYEKAKNTLIEGITGKNKDDIEDEFIAYWETNSNFKDKLFKIPIYSIIQSEPETTNSVSLLFYSYNKSKNSDFDGAILFNNEENTIDKFISYFNDSNAYTKEYDTFYVGELDSIQAPPFAINCEKSLLLINEDLKKEFRIYFKKNESNRFVFFKKNLVTDTYYLGWLYPEVKKTVNGFRDNQLTGYQATFNKSLPGHRKNVIRISSQSLNPDRLIKRTASDMITKTEHKFLIAGVGSVGSHLVALLNSLNNPELTLIDNDVLGSENIKRHFLGFRHLGQNKAQAMKSFFKDKIPLQDITASPYSFFDYYFRNKDNINTNDYIFLCMGKLNLEKWFINELQEGNLKKPLFIIWVEPFLLGGQLLYIHPNNTSNLSCLFEDIYKYKFSIIAHKEFELKRELFVLKERGCQSTYSPYSSTHLSIFISSVYLKITSIIENNSIDTQFYSWIGDIEIAERLGIILSKDDYCKYTLIKNDL